MALNLYQSSLQNGTILYNGKYKIIEDTPDAGGFGRVYKAAMLDESKDEDRIVAIKEFCINDARNLCSTYYSTDMLPEMEIEQMVAKMRDRFYEEVKILTKLNEQHDCHVPEIIDNVFAEDGRLFYAMEWIEGQTLTEHIESDGLMSEKEAVDYITQIGKVLYKVHQWHVVHSDVSPNNIMIRDNLAVLVDFGNAKSYDQLMLSVKNNSMEDIEKELGIGTPGFMAPLSLMASPQRDIYSLAATLYYLLTGERNTKIASEKDEEWKCCKLKRKEVSEETIYAITNTLNIYSKKLLYGAKAFLSALPSELVFDTLLNYNDTDYKRL